MFYNSTISAVTKGYIIMQHDEIVDIKDAQIRYFGGPGKMLLPTQATVAAQIKQIPAGHLITTDLLRKRLADQFGVQGTCPVTTKKALTAIAADPAQDVPYWRVIKQNGELMAYYPGGVTGHASLLAGEGFTVTGGKKPKINNFRHSLIYADREEST